MPMSIVGTLDGAPFTFRPEFGLYSDNTPYAKGLPPEGMEIIDVFIRQSSLQDFVACMLYLDSNVTLFWNARLVIPFYPGARQDRRNVEGDVLRTKSFVTSLVDRVMYHFTEVVVFDMHSDQSNPDGLVNIRPAEIFRSCIQRGIKVNPTPFFYDAVVAPDHGARERAQEVADLYHIPLIVAEKVRDLSTGRIIEYNIDTAYEALAYEPKKILVVDDICDGGATFNILAKSLPADTVRHLFVTHGLFSRGLYELADNYDRIITTNSVFAEKNTLASLTVIDLFPGVEL